MDNCFICNKKLNKLNTPLKGVSKTKDNKTACTNCHRTVSVKLHKTNFNDGVSQNILEGLKAFEVNKQDTQKREWYEKKRILIPLLFLLPPVGIYGIFKKDTDKWKKVVYTLIGVFMTIYLISLLLLLILPNMDYSNGNKLYELGNYEKAIFEYKKVEKDDENYQNALQKIQLAQSKLDSIANSETMAIVKQKQDAIAKTEKLTAFQKQWADSIVNSWKGEFIISHNLKSIDTIQFELSKGATEIFNSNVKSNLPMYQSMYEKSLKHNLNKANNEPKTVIEFIPNKELSANANPNEWQHPTILNRSLKIYSGNQYSKEYLGVLVCKFKDKNRNAMDGNQFVVIEKPNGNLVEILRYNLSNKYWIKTTDPNRNSATGLSNCY